jgi:hypothetical protein
MLAALMDIDVPAQERLEFLGGKARPRPTAWSGGRSRVQPSGCLPLLRKARALGYYEKGSLPLSDPLSPYSAGLFARLDQVQQEMGRLLRQGRRDG